MKKLFPLVLVLLLLPRPAQAHSETEIGEWEADWIQRVQIVETVNWNDSFDSGAVLMADLMAERWDFESRHPCHYAEKCEQVHAPAGDPAPKSQTASAPPKVSSGWRPLVEKYFDPDEVETMLCLMKHESGGDPGAVNPSSGAAGLFQIMPGWEKEFGLDRLDPESNVKMAKWILDIQGYRAWNPYKRGECHGL